MHGHRNISVRAEDCRQLEGLGRNSPRLAKLAQDADNAEAE
jgi:hypothetical protein